MTVNVAPAIHRPFGLMDITPNAPCPEPLTWAQISVVVEGRQPAITEVWAAPVDDAGWWEMRGHRLIHAFAPVAGVLGGHTGERATIQAYCSGAFPEPSVHYDDVTIDLNAPSPAPSMSAVYHPSSGEISWQGRQCPYRLELRLDDQHLETFVNRDGLANGGWTRTTGVDVSPSDAPLEVRAICRFVAQNGVSTDPLVIFEYPPIDVTPDDW